MPIAPCFNPELMSYLLKYASCPLLWPWITILLAEICLPILQCCQVDFSHRGNVTVLDLPLNVELGREKFLKSGTLQIREIGVTPRVKFSEEHVNQGPVVDNAQLFKKWSANLRKILQDLLRSIAIIVFVSTQEKGAKEQWDKL